MRTEAGQAAAIRRLAVIGVGLMGGSLALAAHKEWPEVTVVGYDSDPQALGEALSRGVLSEAADSAGAAASGSDLVVISTPVRSIPQLVKECMAAEVTPRLITDLGSTKTQVMRLLDPEARTRFIGGHPMCGGETAGVRYARANLFEGATYFLSPPAELPGPLFEIMHGFVSRLGARPITIEPETHDRIMALISHVPHVLANVMMSEVGGFQHRGRRALYCAGPSFRDLTRVAGANPVMWGEIFLENREALVDALRAIAGDIQQFCDDLERQDESGVAESISTAAAYRQELLQKGDREPAALYQITVRIPDEPGLLSRVMTTLGNADINIEDLTLHHYSRKAGGDLVLYVTGEVTAATATGLLEIMGFPAVTVPAAQAVD